MRRWWLIISVLIPTTQGYGVTYVPTKKLADVVSSKVDDCSNGGKFELPIITWGGDIATIFANGNTVKTSKGSLFDKAGLSVKLKRQDVFAKQVESYLRCDSPFLRGTLSMINLAADVANKDPRTSLNVFYQLTWSAGGDALVVKSGMGRPADLKGKTIALQAYGPHIDYLGKVLADAGLSMSDVKLKWVEDLTGTDNTPMAAFYEKDIDAALVIIPDGLALTSGGNVGTGAEDSVKGAKILLSTKSANRIISDVYAVRSDFLKENREVVRKLVAGLVEAQTSVRKVFKKGSGSDFQNTLTNSAKILLDSEQATEDTKGMYLDAEFVSLAGNRKFFSDKNYPRRFEKLNQEIGKALFAAKLIGKKPVLEKVVWKYDAISGAGADQAPARRFDEDKVAKVVTKRQQQNSLGDGSLFSFQVFFQPNQNEFTTNDYGTEFNRVLDLASTYGGAVITVEGHSDPLGYLRKKKNGATKVVLSRIKQAAKNLSLTRANAVRSSIVNYAKTKGVGIDPSQFAVVGHGINKPKSGKCGSEPCAPKSKQQWLDNMRVEFRIIQVEAEEDVFNPL